MLMGCRMKALKGINRKGFTMMELMLVVVIVAILVSIAYPSYIQYVRKSKRGEAQQLLMNWAINQEIWRSNHTTYAGTGDLAVPTHDDYTFDFAVDPTASVYTLRATARNDQLNDESRDGTGCSPMTMTQSGVKAPPVCWE